MHLTTLLLAITAALPITFAVPAAATAAKCPDDNPKAYCCKVYGPETPGECPTGVCAEGKAFLALDAMLTYFLSPKY